MVELVAYVALQRLVEAAEAVEESLMPNEREMLHSLKDEVSCADGCRSLRRDRP